MVGEWSVGGAVVIGCVCVGFGGGWAYRCGEVGGGGDEGRE